MQVKSIISFLALSATLGASSPTPAPQEVSPGDIEAFVEALTDFSVELAEGDAEVALFSDGECANYLKTVTVRKNSCFTGSDVGWSSMQIVAASANFHITQGTLTAYTKNDCGCPTCGSHGYSFTDLGCLKDFDMVANAVGLGGV
ncbi:hypothetical protein PVAR5_7455 [Paecilomyces variotii No. 5]|uniref:Uncharacterized protein n=1 Tax=Byssochlamys spectabilis (strain No. 5 / NBRC 109023) TaxID=1356009 RepID=V5FLC6_BYSSN|nr:hypothetical protein PVAR5_7455 [Paecilomyces variotii No. 5]